MQTTRILYCESNKDGTIGGSYHSLLQLVQRLDKNRYKPIVVFYTPNRLIPAFEAAGADVHIAPSTAPLRFSQAQNGWLRKCLVPLQRAARFSQLAFEGIRRARFLRRERIDLVHLNNSVHLGHDWMLAARLLRIPCMTHQRGILDETRLRGGLAERLTRYHARHLDAVISISDAVSESLRGRGIQCRHIVTIHNGIDPDGFSARASTDSLRRAHDIPAEAPIIGVIGNVKGWKGQETAVRATALLKRHHPEIRCLLVGDIPDKAYGERLQHLRRELDITCNVVFTGFKDEVADYVSLLDVMLHTSVTPEPFGRVLLEGMLLQRPVIATAIGGPLEIIEHGKHGFLVPPNDPEALARTAQELLASPELRRRIGQTARAHVLERFTIDHNLRKTEAIYQRLLSRLLSRLPQPVQPAGAA